MYVKPITICGVEYPSRAEAAKALGLDPSALYARLRYGWTDDDFKRGFQKSPWTTGKPVTILGVEYGSRKEAAKAFGISDFALRHRLNHGWTDDDFKRGFRKRVGNHRPHEYCRKPITICGITYPSRRAAAQAFNIAENTFYVRLERGWTEEDFVRGYRYDLRSKQIAALREKAKKLGFDIVPIDPETQD